METKEQIIRKSLKKRYLLFFTCIFLCIPLIYSQVQSLRLKKYERKTIPHTDKFLKLLINKKYKDLYNQYALASGLKFDLFKEELNKIEAEFGTIKSFSNARMSFSMNGTFGDIVGFLIGYTLIFENGKSYHGSFWIELDKNNRKPIPEKIYSFDIEGDYGKKYVEIRLIQNNE